MTQPGSIAALPANPNMKPPASKHICVHLRGSLRSDVRAQRNIQALVQAGFIVSIIDFEDDSSRLSEKQVNGANISHLYAPNWSQQSRFSPRTLVKLLGMVIRGSSQLLKVPADVYHAGDLRALPAAYIAARLRRKLLIFEAYELPLVQPYLMKRRFLWKIAASFLKVMLRRCNGVITVSQPLVPELQQRYGGPTATVVRSLPIYQPSVKSDRLRQRLNLGPETRIALYQGGIQDNRSLDKLIYAAPFLAPNTIIVLLGKGPSQARLEALITEMGVGDRVKIVPAVPYEELLEWTASADIGLTLFLPSWSVSIQLCLPNKLFEYLMAGLPVLTSPLEAIVDIIQRYEVGRVVASLEPEAIGKAINDFLADSQALEQMRAHALQASERELHWEVERQRLIDFYQQLVGVKA